MRYEFKSWAEYKDFMSEHWIEIKEGDEIVVDQPMFKGDDAIETKIKVITNYGKEETK